MGGRKSPFPSTLAIGLYNSLYCRTSRATNDTVSATGSAEAGQFAIAAGLELRLNYLGQGNHDR